MLKITIHDGSDALKFQLAGKLVGAWATELEHSWRTAESMLHGKPLQVDLQDVTFIDNAGKAVLRQMCEAGAIFYATAPLTRALVEEATCAKVESPRHGRHILALMALLTLAVGIARAANAPEVQPAPLRLSLKDAIQLSLRQNPDVQIANLNLAQSQQQQTVSRSALLPQAGIKGSDGILRGNIQTELGTKIPGFPNHLGPFYVMQLGPTFSTPVFDLTAFRRWEAAKQITTGTAAQQLTVREQNVLLVVSQYLGCLRALADVKAAQSRVDLAKALYELADDLQKNGVGTGIDTLRSNVQYQNEKQRLINAQTDLKTSLFGLSRLLNIDPHEEIELTDQSAFFETPELASENALEQAYSQRPEIKTLQAQIRSELLQQKASQASRLPRLSIDGGWSLQGVSPTTAIPVYQYEASFEVPLFTGGRIKAETAIAGIEARKLEQQQQDLRNRIALEVKTASEQLTSARGEVDVAALAVRLSREELTQAKDRFQAGVANNIEVITAQDELARANDNQIAALYRYNQARADLAHATGQMEALYAK